MKVAVVTVISMPALPRMMGVVRLLIGASNAAESIGSGTVVSGFARNVGGLQSTRHLPWSSLKYDQSRVASRFHPGGGYFDRDGGRPLADRSSPRNHQPGYSHATCQSQGG